MNRLLIRDILNPKERPPLNKWVLIWKFYPSVEYMDPFYYRWTFGIFKFVDYPEPGVRMHKPYYKGFFFSFLVLLPIVKD